MRTSRELRVPGSGRLESSLLPIAKRTSAVPTTSKSRREGVLGKIAMSLTVRDVRSRDRSRSACMPAATRAERRLSKPSKRCSAPW